MDERLNAYIPFVLAVLFPPVGLVLGLLSLGDERGTGIRLLAVSIAAAAVWLLLFTA